jgi:hypothetical protein
MKVLQTLERHKHTAQEGIFQYRRTRAGVEIDASIGRADLDPAKIVLSNDEWVAILKAIGGCRGKTFRLTWTKTAAPPKQSLYNTISRAVPKPGGGWKWNDSYRSYVAAVLEHEGSIDHYGGVLGRGVGHPIVLARDL